MIQTPQRLIDLGWSGFYEAGREAQGYTYEQVGRIIAEHKTEHVVATVVGDIRAKAAGNLLFLSDQGGDLPKVGDWVGLSSEVKKLDDLYQIKQILPRKTVVSRTSVDRQALDKNPQEQIIATNIDTLFIVQGLDDDFNVRRLERYLLLAQSSGATVVIVLTKADVAADIDTKVDEIKTAASHYPVVVINATDAEDINKLRQYIQPTETVALIGSSGVGKSTITNGLLSHDYMKTGAVREDDSKGRHTTTHREIVLLPDGGLLVDNPGIRELSAQLDAQVDDAFDDITALAESCYYRNCHHSQEPRCAIKEALTSGNLTPERWESFLKLKKEQEYLAVRESVSLAAQKKKETARIHKQFNQIIKDKRPSE